jgi:hypothetical protein
MAGTAPGAVELYKYDCIHLYIEHCHANYLQLESLLMLDKAATCEVHSSCSAKASREQDLHGVVAKSHNRSEQSKKMLPQLGIEPSAIPWEGIMLPLHH